MRNICVLISFYNENRKQSPKHERKEKYEKNINVRDVFFISGL